MKPIDDLKAKFNIYKGKDAQTVSEMAKSLGISDSAIRRAVPGFVSSGKWQEVRVQRNKVIVTAYRKVAK